MQLATQIHTSLSPSPKIGSKVQTKTKKTMSPSEVSVNVMVTSSSSKSSSQSKHKSNISDFPPWLSNNNTNNNINASSSTSLISSSSPSSRASSSSHKKGGNSLSKKSSSKSLRSTNNNETLSIFKDLQQVESELDSHTNQLLGRMKKLFDVPGENNTTKNNVDVNISTISNDSSSSSYNNNLGEKLKRSPSASKRSSALTPTTNSKPLLNRRISAQDSAKSSPPNSSSSMINGAKSEEKLNSPPNSNSSSSSKHKKKDSSSHNNSKRKPFVDTTTSTKARAMQQLEDFTSFRDFNNNEPSSTKRLSGNNNRSKSSNSNRLKKFNNEKSVVDKNNLIIIGSYGDDIKSDIHGDTPSPLLPVFPPLSKNIQGILDKSDSLTESILSASSLTTAISLPLTSSTMSSNTAAPSSATRRRKSVVEIPLNNSSNHNHHANDYSHGYGNNNIIISSSLPKNSNIGRNITPTVSFHRSFNQPQLKDTQLPPPISSVPPSLLPQPKSSKDFVPPLIIPPVPSSIMKDSTNNISSDKKIVSITAPKGDFEDNKTPPPRSSKRDNNRSTDGHASSSKKAVGRKRGTLAIINNNTVPQQLEALHLPPMNVQALPPVKIPKNSNSKPSLSSKTPTLERNSRIPSTPTSAVSTTFSTKLPTPTGIKPRVIKSGSGIPPLSQNNHGHHKSTRVAPVSPNKPSSRGSSSVGGRKSSVSQRKTPTTIISEKPTTPRKSRRRLSNAIINIFSKDNNKIQGQQHSTSSLSNFSKASTSTGISTTTNSALIARKQRTNSQPAPNNINHSSSHLGTSLHNSSNHLKSPSSLSSLTDLESSSSTTSTPCGYKTIDEEIFLAVGDENSNSLNYLNDLEQEKRKLRAQKKKEQQDARFELSIPMKPQEALKTYAPYLSLYERTEIMDFPEVYFVGPNAAKAAASPELKGCNYGFDDERGDYKVVMGDHLCFRFEIVDTLGKGSFGQVLKCLDHKTGEYIAVKIIRNKKRFHCQALVEVNILENLTRWLLSMNLYEFIKKTNFQGFSLGLIKRFCVQLLNSLSLLQRHRIVHCDLKPENVLLKHPTKSSIKVIDFVILGMTYNMAIDMWSLGCILAELYTGYPLFPGENEQEQLACIMEVQGVPSLYLIEKSTRKKLFFDGNGNPRPVINSKGKRRKPSSKSLGQALKCSDEVFLDFISRCLQWDPEKH
nr:12695_t:CDS:10 [Entrophospora candida]